MLLEELHQLYFDLWRIDLISYLIYIKGINIQHELISFFSKKKKEIQELITVLCQKMKEGLLKFDLTILHEFSKQLFFFFSKN